VARRLQPSGGMSEAIHVFQTPIAHGTRSWTVQAWGEALDDGRWEGWLVFVPADGTLPLATARETTQASREALAYWAGGLAPTYLEGAFKRAIATAA
jgi:hypothetical protein